MALDYFLPGGEAKLSIIIPKHTSREVEEMRKAIGERTSLHVAALAIAVANVKNVSGFEGGFRENGDPYLYLSVRPSKQYSLDVLAQQCLEVSERINGLDPKVLRREFLQAGRGTNVRPA